MTELPARDVVGLEPRFPWPLSAWAWWTTPVRAERLAALRVGMAGWLLVDQITTYRERIFDFFGTGGLGGARAFAYYGEAPRLNWSLLRGPGDPILGTLALIAWMVLTVWFAVDASRWLWSRERRIALGRARAVLWLASGAVVALGIWSRANGNSDGPRILRSWQDDPLLLQWAFWAWVAATLLLMLGYWTRTAAALAWALTISFANANPYIDNAGDTIRGITLFYLVLCPCGAVWSLDSLMRWRRRAAPGPVYVWPWALRLLFIQLVLIYFMNGLYKMTGATWLEGDSLYYVLGDLTLTRFSLAQLPVSFELTRLCTWLVLCWELSFPVLILFGWTRRLALVIGVLFHVGIWLSLELGGFAPYILCLYLPLVPWERWTKS